MKTENMKPDFLRQRILSPRQLLKLMILISVGISIYSCDSIQSPDYQSRIRAVNKLTDQNLLSSVAWADTNYEVRIAALNKITDQNLIYQLAIDSLPNKMSDSVNHKVRLVAFNKITGQNLIFKVAIESNDRALRLAAIDKITDQNLIFQLTIKNRDPELRHAEVEKITDQNLLYKLAVECRDRELFLEAVKKITDKNFVKKVAIVRHIRELRLAEVKNITNQPELINISQNNFTWEVRKAAFKKLNNNSLDILTREAKDSALILSAKIRLGRISWQEAGRSAGTLGDIVGAAALVDNPKPTSSDVVSACHKFIQLGDASRIPELIFLLNKFGDVSLAEDYMNCGESTLEDAGCRWGRAHGYNCTTGYGSNRVRWGSKK